MTIRASRSVEAVTFHVIAVVDDGVTVPVPLHVVHHRSREAMTLNIGGRLIVDERRAATVSFHVRLIAQRTLVAMAFDVVLVGQRATEAVTFHVLLIDEGLAVPVTLHVLLISEGPAVAMTLHVVRDERPPEAMTLHVVGVGERLTEAVPSDVVDDRLRLSGGVHGSFLLFSEVRFGSVRSAPAWRA
jgi:hypothetical protein